MRDKFGEPRSCFRYFSSNAESNDGFTGDFDSVECLFPEDVIDSAATFEAKDGDVFDLMSGTVPYAKETMEIPAWPGRETASSAPP